MNLTCLVISSEATWLTERLHDVLPARQLTGLSVLDGVHDSGAPLPDLLITDDLRHPAVARVIRRRGRPTTLSTVVVLSWDEPLHLSALVGVGRCRAFTLPAQAEAAGVAIEMLSSHDVAADAAIQFDLPDEWPGVLRIAVNRIQRCLADPAADPPPPSVAELARQLSISRPNLSRSATKVGFPLRQLIDAVRVRWAVTRYQAGYSAGVVATDLGYSRVDSLARLAKRVTGTRWSEVRGWPVERLDPVVVTPMSKARVEMRDRVRGS